ncbi:SSI family serine proteinase inhibitor [Actinophytocola xanthii]|uniref:Subtilisin inhibitor domain-containing protein n=1 Tax=Actinophytocola xanthii TaxID=1912961 RepID=A0A1Q8C3M9_9PSEU|nr:SSI family serine proteinase inhibitor [Actinophytocola xanthii]OLF08962.1 hypothetical protein BU204_33410 [Actinophytocola xanthii]
MTSHRLGGTLLALAASLSVVLAPTADAEPRTSTLTLAVLGPEGALHVVRLLCDPPGGTHPAPVRACRELAAAGGDFDELGREDGMCTMEYRPVVAVARGDWDGEPVRWRERFANPCLMSMGTGTVFDF